jgi:N-methylhydantoinase A/oxoprolinase/acetone carboxylase beta subunit
MIDIRRSAPAAQSRAWNWVRCMGAERGRATWPGLLWPRRQRPAITDANLVLGRLGADRFLGGEMRLDLRGQARVGRA